MSAEHRCPRRDELFGGGDRFPGPDTWRDDNTCSYCGSLNPDVFMARLEAGDVEIDATDKNYKVYVHNVGGESFKQTYRDCPRERTCTGPGDCTHWVTRESSQCKFYFPHLSRDQKIRFVELLNEKKIKFGGGIGFYVLPYFIQ